MSNPEQGDVFESKVEHNEEQQNEASKAESQQSETSKVESQKSQPIKADSQQSEKNQAESQLNEINEIKLPQSELSKESKGSVGEPVCKKLRVDEKDLFFENIKKQIQNEIIKDIIVGTVHVAEWQSRCEILPGIFIDLLNPDTSELPLTQSPFGYKKDTLIDLDVRNCKEVSLSQCDRQLRFLAQRIIGSEKYCEPYKLVVYEEDGHFEQHTDTPEKNLVKSLVFHLPTECDGGDLMFHTWNTSEHFTTDQINFVLFNINHPHRVTRVTKGKKISLLFKVFEFEERCPWKNVISGEHCYSTINIPSSYINVLFTHPDSSILEDLLTRSELNYEKVYYDYETPKPKQVFTDIEDADSLSDSGSGCHYFDALTKKATKFMVEHMVDLGEPCIESDYYTRHYGYTGNNAISEQGTINYFTGYLINPQPVLKEDLNALNSKC